MTFTNAHISLLKQRLQLPLPGKDAQNKMAPSVRNYISNNQDVTTKLCAVLMLLFEKNGELHITFFKRSEYEGHHGGQNAFPGGKSEKYDSSLQQTALRETYEEFGIPNDKIEIIGSLSKLYIPISNLEVTPFIGYISTIPDYITNPIEVAYIFEIPIKQIVDDSFKAKIKKYRHDQEIETPMYIFENHEIWGATAMITSEFESILKEIIIDSDKTD